MNWKRIFWLVLLTAILGTALGFSFGVNHVAQQQMKKEKNYKPLYTSRILITCGDMRAIAFTSADCDPIRAKDDGWWFNKLMVDSSSTIVVEDMEWPYSDSCID